MKIVISGDSFTYGQGCKDRISFFQKSTNRWIENFNSHHAPPSEYAWSSLLKKQYPEIEIVNVARPGADITYICQSILDHIYDADIVFFGATSLNRMQIQSRKGNAPYSLIFSNYANDNNYRKTKDNDEYTQSIDFFIKNLYLEEYFTTVFVASIWSIYGQCLKRNIPFIWSSYNSNLNSEKQYIKNLIAPLNELDTFRILCITDFVFNHLTPDAGKKNRHEDGHANEYGHEHYFNSEILPVFSKLIESSLKK
jgi:hypothetical protein